MSEMKDTFKKYISALKDVGFTREQAFMLTTIIFTHTSRNNIKPNVIDYAVNKLKEEKEINDAYELD